ncbi:unnamed protein product [Didymodactylos carnosus]|uniref:Spondin-1 n=1 Tax=Didymodactylos carnosus TaxID=1234261 RepID=A0A814FHE9_9BILA|nr:unnamed protein product [Didymodactylos carnosus]CAF3758042.1 unnamed protein product [Didymodactylos carnosus]
MKNSISVNWVAPKMMRGCVTFRATVVRTDHIWFKDDGGLSYTMCEDRNMSHFSTLIGAVHNNNYTLFELDGYASKGLHELALYGITDTLEQELINESFSSVLRNIVLAKGLNANELQSSSNTSFTVSPKHHKLSVISKFAPSPDWFAGINSFDLCLSNCTWIDFYSEDLYLYDAGVDSGRTYTSEKLPTVPQEKIHSITTNDGKSPFFDPMKKSLQPVARLSIKKTLIRGCHANEAPTNTHLDRADYDLSHNNHRNQRIRYKYNDNGQKVHVYDEIASCFNAHSTCPSSLNTMNKTKLNMQETKDRTNDDPMCMTTKWGPWSACSVSCGEGMRTRSRTMLKNVDAARCGIQLMEKEECRGMKVNCDQGRLTDMMEKKRICMQSLETGPCTNYERRYYLNIDMKKCVEFEFGGCDGNENNFLTRDTCEDTCDILLRGRTEDGKDTRCMTIPWSEWSACTASCGTGTQVRFRSYKVKFLAMGFCGEQLEETRTCETPCDSANMHRLSDSKRLMIKNMDAMERKGKCLQPLEPGPCTSFSSRYYFDGTRKKCTQFRFGGCRGNDNNFATAEECEEMCIELIQKKLTMNDPTCLTTMWGDWSECSSVTCDKPGVQWRYRSYVDKTAAAGKCNELLTENQICTKKCLMAEESIKSGPIKTPQRRVRNRCCACDDAKYEATFQGLWSRQTHPKDWPRVWEYGNIASDGLKHVAEWGAIGTMQKELRNHTKFGVIRNIVVIPGLWTVNVAKSTTGYFTTSRNHNFFSFVTMLGPSPDWIAGISGLDLCLPNCTWLDSYEESLYPVDAGTDMGVLYDGPKKPNNPREPIQPIIVSRISDTRSPFYDETGRQMLPVAKITIKRQMLRGESCPNGRLTHNPNQQQNAAFNDYPDLSRISEMENDKEISKTKVELIDESPTDMRCMTSEWSTWSECNVKCGNGLRQRTRMYKNAHLARGVCNERLSESEMCFNTNDYCEDDIKETAICAVSEWSSWSPCTVSCGKGYTERVRWYLNDQSTVIGKCQIYLNEKRQCQGAAAECETLIPEEKKAICMSDPKEDGRCRNLQRYYFDKKSMSCLPFKNGACANRGAHKNNFQDKAECEQMCNFLVPTFEKYDDYSMYSCPPTTQWTTWSECSVSCGRGWRTRTRAYIQNSNQMVNPNCPPLEERELCQMGKCHCIVSQWSSWSPCTQTCGPDAVQIRTRSIIRRPKNNGRRCGPLKETRYCPVPNC